jgi:hypothetical protein
MYCNSFILGKQGVFARAEMNSNEGEGSLKRGSFQPMKSEALMPFIEFKYALNKVPSAWRQSGT